MPCSAGDAIPWLALSRKDVALPANTSQDIVLAYNAAGVAAGTYRAQLCLFAYYSYSEPAVLAIRLCPVKHLVSGCYKICSRYKDP